MEQSVNAGAERQYVDSLRWRQQDLQGKLDAIGLQIAACTREGAELKQQLRAVEQLLSAAGEDLGTSRTSIALTQHGIESSSMPNGSVPDPNGAALNFSSWGPKARAIYATTADVIREAGVPLHYRVLAEEVQKRVALTGVDPGATLIAHLARAQEIFPRVGRGIYGLQGMAPAAPLPATSTKTPAGRRRKTRRRTR